MVVGLALLQELANYGSCLSVQLHVFLCNAFCKQQSWIEKGITRRKMWVALYSILEFFHAHQQGRVLHVIDGEGTKKGDWKRKRERARYREMSKTSTPKALSSCWPYNRFPESSSRRDLTRASTAWRVSNSPAYLAWETIDRPCWRCLSDLSERCRLVRKRRRKRWRQDIAGCQRGSTVFWKRP